MLADDAAFFAEHADRSYRVRRVTVGDAKALGAIRPGELVVVRQLAPGCHAKTRAKVEPEDAAETEAGAERVWHRSTANNPRFSRRNMRTMRLAFEAASRTGKPTLVSTEEERDAAFFREHPERTYRLRPGDAGDAWMFRGGQPMPANFLVLCRRPQPGRLVIDKLALRQTAGTPRDSDAYCEIVWRSMVAAGAVAA